MITTTLPPAQAEDTERTARQFDALSYPHRLVLLRLIAETGGTLGVEELEARLDTITQPIVSQHLMKLYDAGLLSRVKRGRNVYYRIRLEGIYALQYVLAGFVVAHHGNEEGEP